MMALLKAAIRQLRNISFFFIDGVVSRTKLVPHVDCALIIRLDAIGDFILWLDAAQSVARHYKRQGKRLILLANGVWADWVSEMRIFDDVIPLDRRKFEWNPLYRYQLALRIRRLGCSIAVQPTYSREWLLGDAVIRMCGARERIGSIGDTLNIRPSQKRISDRWYTYLIPAAPAPRMELLRNAEFVRGLVGEEFRAKVPNLPAVSSLPGDSAFAAEIPAGEPYYLLFPGASWAGKQWPLANFVQVAELLHGETGWRGVVCGGPADCGLAVALCSQSSAPLLNWAGRTNLSQLAAVLSGAKLLLTNDTSAIHLAAAAGVPAACVLGGGHFGRFMPYEVEQRDERPLPRAVVHKMDCFGCNWRCVFDVSKNEPVPCISQIGIATTWQAILELLGLKGRMVSACSTTRLVTREQPDIRDDPDSEVKTTLFLPPNSQRKGEGGLRTKGYFKASRDGRPLVSVITAVFNGERHLEQTILSVLNQTYDNVEYIIIDGGSTDGTLEIIKEYEDKIDIWVSESDKGISDAFNKGIALSSGEIIGIINSDDWYEPESVEIAAHQFLESGADIVHGKLKYWDSAEEAYVETGNHRMLNRAMTINHPTMFVKRTLYERVGLFRTDFRYAMDYEWVLRAKLNGVRFSYADHCLANMRLAGLSDMRWKDALKEVARAKSIHIHRPFRNHFDFMFQLTKGAVRRVFERMGLRSVRGLYRASLAALRRGPDV